MYSIHNTRYMTPTLTRNSPSNVEMWSREPVSLLQAKAVVTIYWNVCVCWFCLDSLHVLGSHLHAAVSVYSAVFQHHDRHRLSTEFCRGIHAHHVHSGSTVHFRVDITLYVCQFHYYASSLTTNALRTSYA